MKKVSPVDIEIETLNQDLRNKILMVARLNAQVYTLAARNKSLSNELETLKKRKTKKGSTKK